MSIDQWGILALIVLLVLLEGVARFRRTRAGSGEPSDRVTRARTSHRDFPVPSRDAERSVVRAAKHVVILPPPLPPRLPQPASAPAVTLAPLHLSKASLSDGAGSLAHQRRAQRPDYGHGVVQWLRPARNLRRAIVVATILGPPSH